MLVLVIWTVFHICSLPVQQWRNISSVLLSALIVHQLSFPSAAWTRSLIDLLETSTNTTSALPVMGFLSKFEPLPGAQSTWVIFFFFFKSSPYTIFCFVCPYWPVSDILFSLLCSFKDWPAEGSTNKGFELWELFSVEQGFFFFNRKKYFLFSVIVYFIKIAIIFFGMLINHRKCKI